MSLNTPPMVCARKQRCLPHLLRDLKRTQHSHKPEGDWPEFRRKLKRLIRDAIRLSKRRKELSDEAFASRRKQLDVRLNQILAGSGQERHARRLVKRLRRHAGMLFAFLDHDGLPFDNRRAADRVSDAGQEE